MRMTVLRKVLRVHRADRGLLAVAVLLLWASFGAVNAQIGPEIGQAFGTGAAVFLGRGMVVALVAASVLVGALAGVVAAWKEP